MGEKNIENQWERKIQRESMGEIKAEIYIDRRKKRQVKNTIEVKTIRYKNMKIKQTKISKKRW